MRFNKKIKAPVSVRRKYPVDPEAVLNPKNRRERRARQSEIKKFLKENK